jgi:hypothetical protein
MSESDVAPPGNDDLNLADVRSGCFGPGDVWVVEGETRSAIVMLSRVEGQLCRMFHCHTCVAAATEWDLVVTDGLPFPVVVCGELYGTVLAWQLRSRVGQVGFDQVEAVRTSLTTDARSLKGFAHGTPLCRVDIRRLLLVRLLAVHNDICAPSRRHKAVVGDW